MIRQMLAARETQAGDLQKTGCCGPGEACAREDCTGTPFPSPGMKATFRSSADSSTWAAPVVVYLGEQPRIVIEPEYAEDGNQVLNFLVDVTDMNILEAADLLAALADTLRAEAPNLTSVPEDVEDRAIASGEYSL
jgi:hypothetical protein